MSYPATIEIETPEKIANWRPLVQWIMAIPHMIIASVLSFVSGVVAFISWLIIVITGKLPAGLANFQVMILRYTARAYAYAGFMYTEYPPFDFSTTTDEPGGSPMTYTIHPQLENRNRLTVLLRIIWAIPAALFAILVGIVAMICWFLAFFAVLFTGRWPAGLRDWVMKTHRVSIRLSAYAYVLVDDYPPFSTD